VTWAWLLAGIALGFPGMEAGAWASHRWIMHGPFWFLHRSHHLPRRGGWEANDAFGLFFSALSIAAIACGIAGHPFLMGAGIGMALYGAAYLLFHDMLAHGRFGRLPIPGNPYLRRLLRAHRLHHAHIERDGAGHFGFLWAPPMEMVGRQVPVPLP
jgi:beta-carotene 3-hydroxylase